MKLKITLFRYGTLLFGKVLEQDESLRRISRDENTKVIFENNQISINSTHNPELIGNELYVRGTDSDEDNTEFYCKYASVQEAHDMAKNIKVAVESINKCKIILKKKFEAESGFENEGEKLRVKVDIGDKLVTVDVLYQHQSIHNQDPGDFITAYRSDQFTIWSDGEVQIMTDGLYLRGRNSGIGTRTRSVSREFSSPDRTKWWINELFKGLQHINGTTFSLKNIDSANIKEFERYL